MSGLRRLVLKDVFDVFIGRTLPFLEIIALYGLG